MTARAAATAPVVVGLAQCISYSEHQWVTAADSVVQHAQSQIRRLKPRSGTLTVLRQPPNLVHSGLDYFVEISHLVSNAAA
jgi:hypothetical protein